VVIDLRKTENGPPTAPVHFFVQGSRFAAVSIVAGSAFDVTGGFSCGTVLLEPSFSFQKDDVMNDQLWHTNMQADLVVAGMAERTQEAYLRAVRQLSQYYSETLPTELSEEQVKDYLLWLRTEKRAAPGTLRIAIGGLRFFYRQTCRRDWNVLERFRIPKEKTLPNVLTVLEVKRIMHAIRLPRFYAYFWTVYSCGLRLNETTDFCLARRRQTWTNCEPSF